MPASFPSVFNKLFVKPVIITIFACLICLFAYRSVVHAWLLIIIFAFRIAYHFLSMLLPVLEQSIQVLTFSSLTVWIWVYSPKCYVITLLLVCYKSDFWLKFFFWIQQLQVTSFTLILLRCCCNVFLTIQGPSKFKNLKSVRNLLKRMLCMST